MTRHLAAWSLATVLATGWLAVCVLAGAQFGIWLARLAALIEEGRTHV